MFSGGGGGGGGGIDGGFMDVLLAALRGSVYARNCVRFCCQHCQFGLVGFQNQLSIHRIVVLT